MSLHTCDTCGSEIRVGDWPWCPHGPNRFHVDAFEPYFDEHISTRGEWITSAHQRRKLMEQRGLDYTEKTYRGKSAPGSRLFFDMGKR